MPGFTISELGHPILILPPGNIANGATAQAFHMKGAAHATIIISFGVQGAAVPTSIVLNQCTDANGSNAAAMGFRWYASSQGGACHDVLDLSIPANFARSSGITAVPLPSPIWPTSSSWMPPSWNPLPMLSSQENVSQHPSSSPRKACDYTIVSHVNDLDLSQIKR